MPADTRHRWSQRLTTLALWTACGASLAWWGLKLSQPAALPPASFAAQQPPALDAAALARALGAHAKPAQGAAGSAPSRLVLHGVLAGTRSGHGAALISVDGKPAKPYRVGAQVEPGLVVQSLGAREVHLGAAAHDPPALTLELPRPHPAPSPPGRGRG